VLLDTLRRRLARLSDRSEHPRAVGANTRGGVAQASPATHSSDPVRIRSRTPREALDPSECALLLLGCQPGILADIADHEAFVMKINAAIDIIRLYDGKVIHARMAFDASDYRFPPMTNKEFATVLRERHLQNGSPDADLHPALAARPDDTEVRTTRLGVFSTTNLDEQLTNDGVTTLIVAGAHTSGALLTTVREAADRDYRLIILVDCATDPDPEVHNLLFQRVFPRQTEIMTAAQLYTSMAANKTQRQSADLG
jgi:nicotinamidase-related amidase